MNNTKRNHLLFKMKRADQIPLALMFLTPSFSEVGFFLNLSVGISSLPVAPLT